MSQTIDDVLKEIANNQHKYRSAFMNCEYALKDEKESIAKLVESGVSPKAIYEKFVESGILKGASYNVFYKWLKK